VTSFIARALACGLALGSLACAPPRDEPGEGGGGGQAMQGPGREDGAEKRTRTRLLEAGAAMLQDTTPVDQIQQYLDGFHNFKREATLPGEQQHQMRAHHYCMKLEEDFTQCVVYDGNTRNARIMGIEYIISAKRRAALPASEQQFWHPHDGEVDSGMLVAPGLPRQAQAELLKQVRTTWGKTWHTWSPDMKPFPMGEPELMWAIRPDQINRQTRRQMDERNAGRPWGDASRAPASARPHR
jgi:hypothetical protein